MNNFFTKTRLKLIFLVFSVLIFFMLFAKADVTPGLNPFKLTKTTYGAGDVLQGYVNMSFSSQSADEDIKITMNEAEQNLSVLNFLIKAGLKPDVNFFCTPKSCATAYETIGSSSESKKFEKGKTIIGGIVIGRNIQFKDDTLEISVRGEEGEAQTCSKSPLTIDVFGDKSVDWQYTEPGDSLCGALLPSACYVEDNNTKSFDITGNPYCEKIFLPVAGKFKLSALVKKNKGEGDLVLSLYDKRTGNAASCYPEEPNETSYAQTICDVSFSALSYAGAQEYYVCIKDDLAEGGYAIKGEITKPLCGTVGLPDGNATADFALFAQPLSIMQFNTTFTFNDYIFGNSHDDTLAKYIQDYISETYNGDCISGCLVPIEITLEQDTTIDNFTIRYSTQGLQTSETRFFELTTKPTLIDMNMTSVSLEPAGFIAKGAGSQAATLFIGKLAIGSEQLLIERTPVIKSILQMGYDALTPIQFVVDVSSPKNNSITSYKWDFGDGSTETGTTNVTTHIYSSIGIFKLKLEATDSEGLVGTKTKDVSIGSPREVLNKTLVTKKSLLAQVNIQIESAGWYKEMLARELEIADISDKLTKYEDRYRLAATDAEYLDIMAELNELNVPKTIYNKETIPSIPLVSNVNSIMPEYIEQLNGGHYDVSYTTEARNAIGEWNYKNLQTTMSSRIIATTKEDNSRQEIATIISMDIIPITEKDEIFFVILLPYERVKFQEEYGQQQLDGAIGFILRNATEQHLNFAVPGRVDPENLVAFGSPYLDELEIVPPKIECNNNGRCEKGENWRNCRQDCKPIWLSIFYMSLVLVSMYGLYIFLQKWYKTKYEGYLFKNRQDLHNMLYFVSSSLRRGKEEKEVIDELKKAGWSGEQVDYAIRKISGKRIGLPEIRLKIKNIKIAKKNASAPKA